MKTSGYRIMLALAAISILASCSRDNRQLAYSGRMEVDSITISSQVSGMIDSLSVEEGDAVTRGEQLGQINTDRLQAQRRQQEAQLAGFTVQRDAAEAGIQQAEAQLAFTRETLAKTEKVLAQGGATQQRRDELATQARVQQANLAEIRSNHRLIAAREQELRAGMDLTDITIRDARIVSPIDGTVLNKFHHRGELAAVGTPLLEVADLSVMVVEIYVPLSRLGSVAIGQEAAVSVEGRSASLPGTVFRVSSQAEFTPKTILTEETRATLVYGVKIRVANPDGILKIGMPVDVRF